MDSWSAHYHTHNPRFSSSSLLNLKLYTGVLQIINSEVRESLGMFWHVKLYNILIDHKLQYLFSKCLLSAGWNWSCEKSE